MLRTRLIPMLFLAMFSFSGCDKLQQMANQEAAPPAENTDGSPATPPAVAEQIPATTSPRSPQEIIDAFLALPNHERTDERLREVTSLPELLDQFIELDLSRSPVTDAGMTDIARLTNLKSLNLSNTRLTNAVFAHIAPLGQLETLLLEEMAGVDGTALATIKEIKSLRVLKLSGTVVGDEAVMQTAELPNLEVLHLNNCRNMVGKGFANLAKQGQYKGLRELAINDTSFGTYGLEHIGSLKSLEVLHAQHADVNDGTFQTIGACSQLRELNLQHNSFAPTSLKSLGRLKQLETLRLDGCAGVVNDAFDFLKTLKQLKVLSLEGCPCTPDAVQTLKTKFLQNTAITYGGKQW